MVVVGNGGDERNSLNGGGGLTALYDTDVPLVVAGGGVGLPRSKALNTTTQFVVRYCGAQCDTTQSIASTVNATGWPSFCPGTANACRVALVV